MTPIHPTQLFAVCIIFRLVSCKQLQVKVSYQKNRGKVAVSIFSKIGWFLLNCKSTI